MRALALLLLVAPLAGCTVFGKGGDGDLAVLQDLAPFEVRVRLHNPAGHAITVEPAHFRLVGADGAVFLGIPSERPDAIGATSLGADRTMEGWVAFQVEAFAQRPMTLVYESGGVRLETVLATVE